MIWEYIAAGTMAIAACLVVAIYACCIAAGNADRREEEKNGRWDE